MSTVSKIPVDDDMDKTSPVASVIPALGSAQERALALVEQGHIIPPSADRKPTKKSEIWSYCAYYIGASGTGPFNFAPAQFQNLLYQAGYDPTTGGVCGDSCVIKWAGSVRPVDSVVLDVNGISFAVQTALFLLIGPYADYGNWRPWALIFGLPDSLGKLPKAMHVLRALADEVHYRYRLGVTKASQWQAATALYVIGFVAFNVSNAYYFAAFPVGAASMFLVSPLYQNSQVRCWQGLARDLPELAELEKEVLEGTKSPAEYQKKDMLARSKLSNISLVCSAGGSVVVLAIALGILKAIGTATTEQNTRAYSILVGYFTAVWVVAALPWFIFEQYRPGQKLPTGTSFLLVGPIQLWESMKAVWKLKQTFLYLVAFFLINDVLNTSGTVINLLQNEVISFDTVKLVELFIVAFGCEMIGVLGANWVQMHFKFSAKTMLIFASSAIVAFNIWGLIGLGTNKVGYHNGWEFWVWQAYLGIFVGGWYSYSNTMISEVTPAPKMYLFFSLFSIVGKTSAFVGPFIASAIIADAGGRTGECFWFLVASGLLGIGVLSLVNVDKAKVECKEFLEQEAAKLYSEDDRKAVL